MRRYLFLLLLATACVPLGTPITDPNAARSPGQQRPPEYYADKALRYQDFTYDPDVKSVQCYVATGQPTEVFQPPVAPLQGQASRWSLTYWAPSRSDLRQSSCTAMWTGSPPCSRICSF